MPEEPEEQQQQFNLDSAIDLVKRQHLRFLVPLLIGWLLVWSASWILPARYKSSTLILVQQPSVPKDYVLSNVNDDIVTRLESLKQQLMSRTRLLMIINKLHLYGTQDGIPAPDAAVQQMQKDISVELVRNEANDSIINSFRVSYSASSPRIAQQVTSELTSLFISYNQQQINSESENTTAFLEKQLENARVILAQQEAKVRQFESAHEGELPSQEASNLQILSGLQAQLQNEQDALNAAKQQQVYLQSLIGQYRTLHPASLKGTDGAPTDLATLDGQLEKMKTDLLALRSRYTDRYPAVQALKASIAQTQKDRDQLASQLAAAKSNTAVAVVDREQSPELLQLRSQLQSNQTEISNREHDITKLTARIDQYQARLNAEPASEQQLAELTRGYEQSQTNYNDLLKKKNDSAMATNMVQMQEGERFSVLDPPTLPRTPDFPNRLKFCGIGLAVGIVLGTAVVALLEFLDDRLHNDDGIENLLPTVVLAEIPEILRPEDERRRKQRVILGWAAGAFVFIVILAGTAISYLHA